MTDVVIDKDKLASKPIKNLIERLYPFNYSITGSGNDAALPIYLEELEFDIQEVESGKELNGWLVPPEWKVEKAEIRKDGKLIYDGTSSPLGVVTQSLSFKGKINKKELIKHLYYSDTDASAIVYHWLYLYRPDIKDWGFCVPANLMNELGDGEYEIDLKTSTSPGTMKIIHAFLQGDTDETIVISAHNCHPYQANDDMSGVATGIELFKRLKALKKRRYSYRLIIAPELIGTAFWLKLNKEQSLKLSYVILLKSVGNHAPLKFQESFFGDSVIDKAAHHVFSNVFNRYESGKFRTIYGNDETVFEAPPFNIPTISLTRWPFKEYHTNKDVPDQLSEQSLQETVDVAYDICMTAERNVTVKIKFDGLLCLSRHGLYKPAPAPGIDHSDVTDTMLKWNLLMNCLPRYFDENMTLLDIAIKHELPLKELYEYIMQWVDCDLVEINQFSVKQN